MNPESGIGPYQLTTKVGAGRMGEVFRARDTRLNRVVAIKVLPRDFVSDADRSRRFEQEAKTLAALIHPTVLTIHDAGVHEGTPPLASDTHLGKMKKCSWISETGTDPPEIRGTPGESFTMVDCPVAHISTMKQSNPNRSPKESGLNLHVTLRPAKTCL